MRHGLDFWISLARPKLILKSHNGLDEFSWSFCVSVTRYFPCDYGRLEVGQFEWMIAIKDGVEESKGYIPPFILVLEMLAHRRCKVVDGELKVS